jgi:hypothetical protein
MMGDTSQAEALTQAAKLMTQAAPRPKGGNGAGSHLVGAAITALQMMAPLAAKMMLPIPF